MSSKADAHIAAQDGAGRLELFEVVELLGADAAAFAQAQTMNDVRSLQDGLWQWNGCLNPKGRVIALFALLRLSADRFWLLLPDVGAQAFSDYLGRFVFRSKLRVSPRPELRALGFDDAIPDETIPHNAFPVDAFPASTMESGAPRNLARGSAELGLILDFSGETRRKLWLAPRDLPLPASSGLQPCSASAWAVQDIAHGLPRLEATMAERFTPQMLGLGALNAYSIRKGCYPGQEIVARTHFLGSAKRESTRLQAGRAMRAGESVLCDGKDVGIVVCTNIHNQHCEAIAVIASGPESGKNAFTLASDNLALATPPFALGLAR